MPGRQWNLRLLGIDFERENGTTGRTPDFAIIGAAKAGTSALAHYLSEHPAVFIAPMKEIHFFDRFIERGVDWYRAQFSRAPADAIAGEATPTYLASPEAVARMAEVMPRAKLIAILREPVDRAYSHYWMQRAKFPDGTAFEEVARAELEGRPVPGNHLRYLELGRYVDQLERLTTFFPRESILVLLQEDLRADPRGVFAQTCRFLGVDDTFVPPSLGRTINPTNRARSERLRRLMLRLRVGSRLPPRVALWLDSRNRRVGYPPMDPALKAELHAHIAPDNARLAAFLGRDLSAWNASSGGKTSRS